MLLTRHIAHPALFLTLAAACTLDRSSPTAPDTEAKPSFAISDARHSGGNSHFYFLPPMVPQPTTTGVFDATLAPVVEVCEWATGCGLVVARFTTQSGTGGNTIGVANQQYQVNWNIKVCVSGPCTLDPAKTYRLRVLVAGTELGFADVDVVADGSQLKNVQTNEYIGLVDGRTLPVKFRIEQGAVAPIGPAGGTAHLGDGAVTLAFPAGATTGDIGVTATAVPAAQNPPDRPALPGTLYEFQPSPTTFAQPVQLTLGYPSTLPPGVQESRLVVCKVNGIRCTAIPGSTRNPANHTVSAPITGFSAYGVIENPDPFDFIYRAQDGIHRWTNGVDVLVLSAESPPGFANYHHDMKWSPDALTVVTTRHHSTTGDAIYRVNIDGTGLTPVAGLGAAAGLDGNAWLPDWSPDGTKLAYLYGNDGHLRIHALATGQVTDFVTLAAGFNAFYARPLWSPDGRFIPLLLNYYEFDVLEVATGQITRLCLSAGCDDAWEGTPVWSPDSRRLANHSYSGPEGRGLYVVNVDGSGSHRVVRSTYVGSFATVHGWSPTSEAILFGDCFDHDDPFQTPGIDCHLGTVNADGSGLHDILAYDRRIDPYIGAWSPDGRWILFSVSPTFHDPGPCGGMTELFAVRPDGTELQELGCAAGVIFGNDVDNAIQWNPTLRRLP